MLGDSIFRNGAGPNRTKVYRIPENALESVQKLSGSSQEQMSEGDVDHGFG